jgi:exo-beta-1,3-glucanase (GH17 family)
MVRTKMLSLAAWLALLCMLIAMGWWLPNRLQSPGVGVHEAKFNSLSYTASLPGLSPPKGQFATAAEVDRDLDLLSPLTHAIRSYAAIEGPWEMPALAQKHGLKLWQGIWLGGDRAQNAREMAKAIEYAHRFPDTIERVIVGNEVLLRRDLPVSELIADIDHVRASVKQPVAYADVSDFWDQFPQVAPHVDVVLIHLLPYWEDVPTGIDHAVETVGRVYEHFVKLFPGKTIAIGETGWPSRGRQRRDAVPGRVNEARFLREFMALSAAEKFDYNFIEAIDQDWKYESEGIVGANWGIFGADRRVKIPPSGALREDPDFAWHAAFSIVCGLMLTALGFAAGRPTRPLLVAFLGMVLGGALGIAQADAAPVLYDAHVRVAAVVNLGGQALLAGLAMFWAAGVIPAAAGRTGAEASRRVLCALRLRAYPWPGLLEDICFFFAWTAAVLQILLVFDPRYREFLLPNFAVPLVVMVARAGRVRGPRGREEILLAATLGMGAVASLVQEGLLNGQSLLWNGCVLVFAVLVWRH